MRFFSKRKKSPVQGTKNEDITFEKVISEKLQDKHQQKLSPLPESEREMLERLTKLRGEVEEVNRRIAENPSMQKAMREVLGREPADTPETKLEKMLKDIKAGGLSYILSPPADFPKVSPEAHRLFFQGSVQGDPAISLVNFNKALEITRQKGHKACEVRLLYNIGVAHYKLGDLKKAIGVLMQGKSLSEEVATDLRKEARKLQRFEEEMNSRNPNIKVFGTPYEEEQLLIMYLEALTKVYEADSQMGKADECRNEIKMLLRKST